jgi:protoporphyrinogen/coproporphyrinogen III oxidase
MNIMDCVVIGGGPAGIAAGRVLKNAGARFKILEAETEPGGRTRSVYKREFTLDQGAAFLASFYSRTLALCREAGLSLDRPGFHPGRALQRHALLIAGELRPHDIGTLKGFLRFPFVPALQKMRTLIAVCRSALTPGLHVADADALAAGDLESARTWAERVLGPEAYAYFVRLAFEPFFFYDTAEVSAPYLRSLLGHSVRWRLLSPNGGMGVLCRALARGLPLECCTRVSAVEPNESGFIVWHGSEAERARTVIIAIPPPAVRLLEIPLSDQDKGALFGIRLIPSVRLNLGYDRDIRFEPPAVTPCGAGRCPIVGISSITGWQRANAPGGRDILRVSASAWRSEELLGYPQELVARELLYDCRVLGLDLPVPDWIDVLEERHAIVRTPPGHFRLARDFMKRDRNGLFFAGDWLTGSTIEGAIRSGEAAATHVTAGLRLVKRRRIPTANDDSETLFHSNDRAVGRSGNAGENEVSKNEPIGDN